MCPNPCGSSFPARRGAEGQEETRTPPRIAELTVVVLALRVVLRPVVVRQLQHRARKAVAPLRGLL